MKNKTLDALVMIVHMKPKLKYVYIVEDRVFITQLKPLYENGKFYLPVSGFRFEATKLKEIGYDFDFLLNNDKAFDIYKYIKQEV